MRLNYKTFGEGKPLIILHGLFGSLDNWMNIGKKLAHSHKVFLLDQRNHGDSPHSHEFTYEFMANDIKEFIDNHSIEKIDLIGHSLGGKTAMLFATKYPQHLSKLVIVDIAPKYYPVQHNEIIQGLNSIDLSLLKSRGEADTILSEYIPTLGIRQFLIKNLKRTTSGFKWKINLPIIEKKIDEVGKAIFSKTPFDKPTLFIRGALSNYIQDSDLVLINKQFPATNLVTIEKANHWVHADNLNDFLKEVSLFLNE